MTFPAWQTALQSQQEQRAEEAGRHHQRLLEELSQQRQAVAEAQRAAASTRSAAEARQKEMAAEISNLHSEVRFACGTYGVMSKQCCAWHEMRAAWLTLPVAPYRRGRRRWPQRTTTSGLR